MKQRINRLSLYTIKILCGIFLCYFSVKALGWIDFTWALISVFLVMSPEGGDAMELAITRIKANLIGAGTGLMLFTFNLPLLASLIIGAIIALSVCELMRLSVGGRSSLAGMVIVLMNKDTSHIWTPSFERVSSVILGCLIALIVTYFFHSVLKMKVETVTDKKEREA